MFHGRLRRDRAIRLLAMEAHQSSHSERDTCADVASIRLAAPLLGNAQEIKRLAPFKRRLLVELVDGEELGLAHELRGGVEAVAAAQRPVEARRDREDAQQQERAHRRRVVPHLPREPLLRDEPQLVVVPREGVDAVDDDVDARQQRPVVFELGGLEEVRGAAADEVSGGGGGDGQLFLDFDFGRRRRLGLFVGPPARVAE